MTTLTSKYFRSGDMVPDKECNLCGIRASQTGVPWVCYPELNIHICGDCILKAYEALEDQENPTPRFPSTKSKQKIPTHIRWKIWQRDNFICQLCGSRQYLTIDHIHPESKGGTLDEDNLQTLCRSCNSRKSSR